MFSNGKINYNQPVAEGELLIRLEQLEKLAIVQARDICQLRRTVEQIQQQIIRTMQTNRTPNRTSLHLFAPGPGPGLPVLPVLQNSQSPPMMSSPSAAPENNGHHQQQQHQNRMPAANFHQPLYQMSALVHPTSAIPPIKADVSFCDSSGGPAGGGDSSSSAPASTILVPSSAGMDEDEDDVGLDDGIDINRDLPNARGQRIKRQSLIERRRFRRRKKEPTEMPQKRHLLEEGELPSSDTSSDEADHPNDQHQNSNRNKNPKKPKIDKEARPVDNCRPSVTAASEQDHDFEPVYVTFRKSNAGIISTLYFKDKEQTQPVEEPVFLESADTWIFSKEKTVLKMPKSLRQLLKSSPFQ